MTLRSKSRGQQWARWLIAAALAVCVYVVAFRVLYEGALGDVFGAMQLRVLLPVLAAFGVFVYETRWDGVARKEREKVGGGGESRGRGEGEEKVGGGGESREEKVKGEVVSDKVVSDKVNTLTTNHEPLIIDSQTSQLSPMPGEAEYAEARGMPHQPIPDVKHDGEYLKMLATSAELGYPRAMAKLGEYAMRRGWTVEAYYWLWRAKKNGMGNLDRTLLQVRSAWANGGFRRESMNEYEGFTHEQGTVGYALLCIDARHNADAAKARLAECAPEFLLGDITLTAQVYDPITGETTK